MAEAATESESVLLGRKNMKPGNLELQPRGLGPGEKTQFQSGLRGSNPAEGVGSISLRKN